MEISGEFWVYPNGDEGLEKTKSCRQGSSPKGTTDQEQGVLLPLHIPIGSPPPPLPAALSPLSEGFVITGSACFLLDDGFHIISVSARWFSISFCGVFEFSSIWASCLLCNLVVFHKSFIINFMWHDHQLGPRTLLDVNCSWGFGKSFCRAWMMEPEAVACTRRIMRELQTTIPDTTIFDTTRFFWLQSWVPILTTEALKLCCSILKIFFWPLSLSFLVCSMYMFASPIWGVHRKLC